jgi:DNA invertase Pin-like site-specific DNA recombinase
LTQPSNWSRPNPPTHIEIVGENITRQSIWNCWRPNTVCPQNVDRTGQLAAALDYVRDGDKLAVTRLDRLARGMGDLLEIAEQLRGKGVALQVLDPAMDTSTAAGELIFHVFGAVASFERKLMLERQLRPRRCGP